MLKLKYEPVAVSAFLTALFGLLVGFGVEISSERISAIMAFVTVVGGLVARQKAVSKAGLQDYADAVEAQRR